MRLPVENHVITSHYGYRLLRGKHEFHDGLDFISRDSNHVFAIADGVVTYDMDNYDELKRWDLKDHHTGGNMLIIDHRLNGVLYHIRYLHLRENLVRVGQGVMEGQLVGYYADVGYSFGPHLHNDAYTQAWKKIDIEKLYKDLGMLEA